MGKVNFKKEFACNVETAVERVTEALKTEGFGILTRIDLHLKIKEKLGKDLLPVVILGACNPQLAYEAFQCNTDVASLLPCNAVIRDLGKGRVSIELASPSAIMEIIGDANLIALASDADAKLLRALFVV